MLHHVSNALLIWILPACRAQKPMTVNDSDMFLREESRRAEDMVLGCSAPHQCCPRAARCEPGRVTTELPLRGLLRRASKRFGGIALRSTTYPRPVRTHARPRPRGRRHASSLGSRSVHSEAPHDLPGWLQPHGEPLQSPTYK